MTASQQRRTLFGVALVACSVATLAQRQAPSIEWRHWGGDAAQTKYSAATEITPANVRRLELAWTWQTIDTAMGEGVRPGGFETTPLMVDDVVYASKIDKVARDCEKVRHTGR